MVLRGYVRQNVVLRGYVRQNVGLRDTQSWLRSPERGALPNSDELLIQEEATSTMAILIDGYNLLHVTGIFSQATGPGSLQKLHAEFVQFLARALDPSEAPHTEIVFDSKGRNSGSRRLFRISDLTVHYAARDEDADTYIADLIAAHSAPRRLVVVSSDHQVQRAARRRRAKPIDSHVWYAELMKSWHQRDQRARRHEDAKPPVPLSSEEVSRWLEIFDSKDLSDVSVSDVSSRIHPSQPIKHPARNPAAGPTRKSLEVATPSDENPAGEATPTREESPDAGDELFPASYLEAIERELLAEPPIPKRNERPKVKRHPKK